MIAIIGSGFGLYGYLPALVGGCGERVVLPESYRSRYSNRAELVRFAASVEWVQDETAALKNANAAVIAVPPTDQEEWIARCLDQSHIRRLILEKPLAESPQRAAALWQNLSNSDKAVRVGYVFRYTPWASLLRERLSQASESDRLTIRWDFLAHHYRHDLRNWKRFHRSGGGAIRFYGIQLIALLAEIGYTSVISSKSFARAADEVERWTAVLAGTGLPQCEIVVDTRATPDTFRVEMLDAVVAEQSDAFAGDASVRQLDALDRRVAALAQLYESFSDESNDSYRWSEATISLWQHIEEKNEFALIDRPAEARL